MRAQLKSQEAVGRIVARAQPLGAGVLAHLLSALEMLVSLSQDLRLRAHLDFRSMSCHLAEIQKGQVVGAGVRDPAPIAAG